MKMCPIDFVVRDQGHSAFITENCLCCIIAFPLLLLSYEDVRYWFGVKKVKGQSHNALILKNVFVHNCFSLTPIIMKLHQRFPFSRGCAL